MECGAWLAEHSCRRRKFTLAPGENKCRAEEAPSVPGKPIGPWRRTVAGRGRFAEFAKCERLSRRGRKWRALRQAGRSKRRHLGRRIVPAGCSAWSRELLP